MKQKFPSLIGVWIIAGLAFVGSSRAGENTHKANSDFEIPADTRRVIESWIKEFSEEFQYTHPVPRSGQPSNAVPATLPEDFLSKEGFVEFPEAPRKLLKVGPPLVGDIQFFDKDGNPGITIPTEDLFQTQSFAVLPKNRSIQVKGYCEGRAGAETWDYPVGTRVAHLLSLATLPPQPFELRVLEKLADDTWSFRVFAPAANPGHGWEEYLDDGPGPTPQFWLEFTLASGRFVRIRVARFNPTQRPVDTNCRGCHHMVGQDRARPRFSDILHTGPCGFVPDNVALYSKWRPEYQALHGEDPFSFDCP